jgi:hypothetical protein
VGVIAGAAAGLGGAGVDGLDADAAVAAVVAARWAQAAALAVEAAALCRLVAVYSECGRRLLTDPADGHLVVQAVRSYRPTAAMRAFVLARAGGVCASRGCTARHGLQIDHDEPYPAGPTSASNTVPLHQPHHDGKTCGAWRHRLDPRTGVLRQVSPLGRVYSTRALAPLGGVLGAPPGRVDEAALLAEDLARRPDPPPEPPPGPEEEATHPPDPALT